jgi:hypothetical protein
MSRLFKEGHHYSLLEDIFDKVNFDGFVISWYHLIDEAIAIDVNKNKFSNELHTAILDVFGKEYLNKVWDKIKERLYGSGKEE